LPGCQPQAKIKDVGNDQPIEGRGKKFFILISPFSRACAKNRERHKKQKTGIQK